MKKSKKKYLAFLDIAITEIVGQRLQTILAKDYAKKINGDVIFYSTETYGSFKNLQVLKQKINEDSEFDGVIFYSILQFCYGGKIESKILKKILKKKIKLIFVRENIEINNLTQLKSKLIELAYFQKTHKSLIENIIKNFIKIGKV